MELCYRYRKLTSVWCSVEILLFGGIIYGWGSLVFILKQEGFYKGSCPLETPLSLNSSFSAVLESKYANASTILDDRTGQNHYHGYIDDPEETSVGCIQQEASLNIWFSIAVGFMYVGLAGLGQLTRKLGTRITRGIFMLVYSVGCLFIAFATPDNPWLLCPGLCCIGLAGLVLFATDLQVANLFKRVKSTVVALICGFFDVSSMTQQIVKIAYENGIQRKYIYIVISVVAFLVFGLSTFVLLPRDYIVGPQKRTINQREEEKDKNLKETEKLNDAPENQKPLLESSLSSCILSLTYLFHVAWMSINMLLFVSFIGLLNLWLENLSQKRRSIVNEYLSLFAYITIFTAVMAVITGMFYDYLRKKYFHMHPPMSTHRPAVFPMIICGVLGLSIFVIPLLGSLKLMILVFIVFTMFRSFVFSIGIAFINEAFPPQHFGALYGLMTFVNGLCSLLQYGLFEWNKSYDGAITHVNIFLAGLAVINFLHPLQLWIRSGKHNGNIDNPSIHVDLLLNQEIRIENSEKEPLS